MNKLATLSLLVGVILCHVAMSLAAAVVEAEKAAEKREQEIVAATQSAIEKNRKSDMKIRVVDAAGRPLPGINISVTQTSHDFLFGCNIYMFNRSKDEEQNAAYKRRFAELFNYATVGFYWQWYEPQHGKPNYPYTDHVVAWCREHVIRMKGHPLLWGEPAGIPPWSHGQPSADIQRQRVRGDLRPLPGQNRVLGGRQRTVASGRAEDRPAIPLGPPGRSTGISDRQRLQRIR